MKYPYHPLGRNQNPFDANDYNLRDFIPRMVSLETESDWKFPAPSLDQKNTPHCVGFAGANFRVNYPTFTPQTNADGDKYYYKSKEYDGQPLQENGSCGRSLAKALVYYGVIQAYAFALDIPTLDYWLLNKGPIMVGTVWTMDMFSPDADNVIHCTGSEAGGHEYLLNAKKPGWKRIHNSWSDSWGIKGEAWISDEEFEKIFSYNGDALTAVELDNDPIPTPDPAPENPGCLSALKKLWGKK